MEPLFGELGRQALQDALHTEPLLAFDFDGTLSPIVERAGDAHVAPEISRRLDRLARLRPVAVVTGRSVADVTGRLGFIPRFVVGSHGAEDPGREYSLDVSPLDGLRAHLAAHGAELDAAGIMVEDKFYSLALHYRSAPDPQRALAAIRKILAAPDPRLQSFGGKAVVNVVLAGAPDKGDAVISLVRRAACKCALFVGDDLNDEAVFERALPNWLTVRVGRDYSQSRASFFLDGYADMEMLLETMLGVLQAA
jgi:trehalose 6-phosphate phosphatase